MSVLKGPMGNMLVSIHKMASANWQAVMVANGGLVYCRVSFSLNELLA